LLIHLFTYEKSEDGDESIRARAWRGSPQVSHPTV
jgi:hypothetical protein